MKRLHDAWFAGLAILLGLAAGYVHLIAPDPTIVALLALMCAMFLGVVRPERPWLWAVIIAASIPGADIYANLAGQPVFLARIEGAFVAGIVSGMVGAYGGSLMRRMLMHVFSQKP